MQVAGVQHPTDSAELPLQSGETRPNEGVKAGTLLLRLACGFYSVSLLRGPAHGPVVSGLRLPLVHIGTPSLDAVVGIKDLRGRRRSWLSATQDRLFLTIPPSGVQLVLTAYELATGVAPELEVRRLDRAPAKQTVAVPSEASTTASNAPGPPAMIFSLRPPPAAEAAAAIEVFAHIRNEGEVRFLDTQWAGRLGRGYWLEAFALRSPTGSPFEIEYRGLAASGAETAWIEGGLLCGSRETGAPLVGFAVRRRAAPGSAFFDCVYSGYFQSGAVVGPSRNGAPCRSPLPNDPLEGLQVRIAERMSPSQR